MGKKPIREYRIHYERDCPVRGKVSRFALIYERSAVEALQMFINGDCHMGIKVLKVLNVEEIPDIPSLQKEIDELKAKLKAKSRPKKK